MSDLFPGPSAGSSDPDALLRLVRHAMHRRGRQIVLRVEVAEPHRRRAARTLLQEGALSAGGQVVDGHGSDLLLIGAEPARTARLRGLLDRLLGPVATLEWCLPADLTALEAYAASGQAIAPLALSGPDLAMLDETIDHGRLPDLLQRSVGRPPAAHGRPAYVRLAPSRRAIARRLGPLAEDPDLMEFAMDRVAARLLAACTDLSVPPSWLGPIPAGWLHVSLPACGTPVHPSGRGVVDRWAASLGPRHAAEAEGLAARRAALARAGWQLVLDGISAGTLCLLAPQLLAADLLRIAWEPNLDPALLQAVGPARIILAGLPAEAAGWAAGQGIAWVEEAASE
jgi:hypothetical protein